MGSYAALSFDELSVHEAKSVVPDTFISLFQEADRRVTKVSDEPEEDDYTYRYAAPRGVVLRRLDIMGFTALVWIEIAPSEDRPSDAGH